MLKAAFFVSPTADRRSRPELDASYRGRSSGIMLIFILVVLRASPDYIGGKGDFPKSSNVINHGAGMEASKHGATIGG
jgi:hypothetical protein